MNIIRVIKLILSQKKVFYRRRNNNVFSPTDISKGVFKGSYLYFLGLTHLKLKAQGTPTREPILY